MSLKYRIFTRLPCCLKIFKNCLNGKLKREYDDMKYADDQLTNLLDTTTIIKSLRALETYLRLKLSKESRILLNF